MARDYVWTYDPKLARQRIDAAEKARIVSRCEAFIRDTLTPRFLPRIVETPFNYVIGIHGVWRGGLYRFVQRYRSGQAQNRGEEFDAPFVRLDWVGPDKFDIQWMRHTGQWHRVGQGVSLEQALKRMETNEILHPM